MTRWARVLAAIAAVSAIVAVGIPASAATPDGGADAVVWAAAQDGAPKYPTVHIDWDIPITMSDGTVLEANVYRPADAAGRPVDERTPTIVNMTPYTKLVSMIADSAQSVPGLSDALIGFARDFDLSGTGFSGITDLTKALAGGFPRNFAVDRKLIQSGYSQVVVDVRGTGFSQGVWEVFQRREQLDTVEVIDWTAAQPWSTGNIGMSGVSYSGINQLQAAAQRPEHLKAIFPVVPGNDLLRDIIAPGGGFGLGFLIPWLTLVNTMKFVPDVSALAAGNFDWKWAADRASSPLTFLDYVFAALATQTIDQVPPNLAALLDDGSSIRQDWLGDPSRIAVPTFVVGGWHDLFANGEPRVYNAIALPPGQKQLLMGDNYHINVGVDFGKPGFPPRTDVLAHAWYDKWLKGIDNGIEDYGPVTLFQQGGGWTTTSSYPRPGVGYERQYLSSAPSGTTTTSLHDGSLTPGVPADTQRLTVGPGVTSLCSSDGALISAGLTAILPGCARDERPHELNGLTFTGAPVAEPTLISGPLTVHLNTVHDASDGYWTVTVNDVYPDGRSEVLSTGQLTSSLRAVDPARSAYAPTGDLVDPFHPLTLASRQPVIPDAPTQLDVGAVPTDAVLQPGHRLRVDVFASNFPKGLLLRPLLNESRLAPQHLQLDPNAPSYVVLPVVR